MTGIRQNGRLSFAMPPTLDKALARAAGLDPGTAAAKAVFVMRRSKPDAKPQLFDFAWDRADGLIAAQQFPLESNDIVYVAEAPIVSIQKVVNTIFQLALPAQILK